MPDYTFSLTSIGEVDVLKDSVNVSLDANQVPHGTFDIESEDATLRPEVFAEGVLYEDGVPLLGGIVTHARERAFAGPALTDIVTEITVAGYAWYATYCFVSVTLAAGTLKSMLTTLVTNLTSYGISLDAGQVNGPTLASSLTFTRTRLDEILNTLSELSGYTWEITAGKKLLMTSPASTAAPFDILDTGPVYQVGDVEVERTLNPDYANRVILVVSGAGPATNTQEFVAADGVSSGGFTYFTTDYPTSQSQDDAWPNVLYFDGVAQGPIAFGVVHLTSNGGLFIWAWDPPNHRLVYDEVYAGVGFPTTEEISVTHAIAYPYEVTGNNLTDQADHGVLTDVVEVKEALSLDAAQDLADALAASRSASLVTVRYQTFTEGLRPGMLQTITLAKRNIDDACLIQSVKIRAHPDEVGTALLHDITAIASSSVRGQWQNLYKQWLRGGTGGVAVTGTAQSRVFHSFNDFAPMTPPVDANFSWLNQGGGSVVDSGLGIYLSAPTAGTAQVRGRYVTAPATPYTLTVAFFHNMTRPDANACLCGLFFRQSSDGKLHTSFIGNNSAGFGLNSSKYTSETVFSAHYTGTAQLTMTGRELWWFRIADNGTNRICSFSGDGVNFIPYHSVGRTDFLTADQIGFGFHVSSLNNVATFGMTVVSWQLGA